VLSLLTPLETALPITFQKVRLLARTIRIKSDLCSAYIPQTLGPVNEESTGSGTSLQSYPLCTAVLSYLPLILLFCLALLFDRYAHFI